jgi:hypothetical protein
MQAHSPSRTSARRRLVAAGLAAAGTAAIAATAIGVSSGSASNPGSRTLRLAAIEAGLRFVDNPPAQRSRAPSASAGDMLVWRGRLLNEANRPAGSAHKVCVVTRAGSERNGRAFFECTQTLKLPAGDITGQTAYRDDQENADVAVTGGTKAYEGARGSMTPGERKLGRRTLGEVTVHLLP